jgi:hypothetical protein
MLSTKKQTDCLLPIQEPAAVHLVAIVVAQMVQQFDLKYI